MTMQRIARTAAVVVGVLALAGAASAVAAHAGGPHGRHAGAFFRERLIEHVDDVLDAAKATPAQRQLITAARDHVLDTIEAQRKNGPAYHQQAIALFEADRIDPAAVAQLRAQNEAEVRQVGDAVVQAITDAHDAFTPVQRRAVVDYLRAQHGARKGAFAGHGAMLAHGMILAHIDRALDALKATDAQRQSIHQAAEQALTAVASARQAHQADFEQGLELFAADRIDMTKLGALRARQQAQASQTGDAIVAAVTQAHDVLTPAQRKQLVSFVQAHHGRGGPMGGHRHMGGQGG